MAKNKEIIGKKSIIKRVVLAVAGTVALVAGGGIVIAGFAGVSMSLLFALEVSMAGVAAGIVAGGIVGGISARTALKVRSNKKKAVAALDEIRQLNSDKTSNVSEEKRAKICQKYAKANLYLTKKRGGSIFGELHSNSGASTMTQTQIMNEIDAYTILQEAATSKRQKTKYANIISGLDSKLCKMRANEGAGSSYLKWTQSFDHVIEGVSVFDRRTEIVCMTKNARESFIELAGTPSTKSTKVGAHISVKYGPASGMRKTFINIEDTSKVEQSKEILVRDVLEYLKGKTNLEIKGIFPITLEVKTIDRQSAKSQVYKTLVFNNHKELKESLEIVGEEKEN